MSAHRPASPSPRREIWHHQYQHICLCPLARSGNQPRGAGVLSQSPQQPPAQAPLSMCPGQTVAPGLSRPVGEDRTWPLVPPSSGMLVVGLLGLSGFPGTNRDKDVTPVTGCETDSAGLLHLGAKQRLLSKIKQRSGGHGPDAGDRDSLPDGLSCKLCGRSLEGGQLQLRAKSCRPPARPPSPAPSCQLGFCKHRGHSC